MESQETVVSSVYYTALNECPERNSLSQKVLMTSQWVQIMIQRITAAEIVVEKQGYASLHESIKATLLTYFVDFSNEVRVLVKRPVPGIDNRSSTIVPLEDSYDTMKKAHIATNHGNPKAMQDWLAKNYLLVHELCAKIYCQLCTQCNTENVILDSTVEVVTEDEGAEKILDQMLREDNVSDHVCSVDILDISQKPDNKCKYLLVYKDRKTDFIQLRPLNNSNEADIAVDLIKILMDFGSPDRITVDAENKKLFKLILEKVEMLCNTKIQLATHVTDNNLIKQVAQNIIEWMEKTNCSNWATGCHVVQWEMNNLEENGTTPFSKVFGYKYTGFGYKSKYFVHDALDNLEEPVEELEEPTKDTNEEDVYIVTHTEDVKSELEDPLQVKSENSPSFVNTQYESDEDDD